MDYSNFYASAAQVIPVLVLIYVVEARGFRRPGSSRIAYLWLGLTAVGELCAMVALSFGSPCPGYVGAAGCLWSRWIYPFGGTRCPPCYS
jgi:hypothetical protein